MEECNIPVWQPWLLVKQLERLLHIQKVVGPTPTPPALLCKIYYSYIMRSISTKHISGIYNTLGGGGGGRGKELESPVVMDFCINTDK